MKEDMDMLKETFQYYLDNILEFEKHYRGKFIALRLKEVLGAYNSFAEAYTQTIKTEKLGTFLIQQATSNADAYTSIYYNSMVTV